MGHAGGLGGGGKMGLVIFDVVDDVFLRVMIGEQIFVDQRGIQI